MGDTVCTGGAWANVRTAAATLIVVIRNARRSCCLACVRSNAVIIWTSFLCRSPGLLARRRGNPGGFNSIRTHDVLPVACRALDDVGHVSGQQDALLHERIGGGSDALQIV